MKKSLFADLILFCIAVSWGYTFVLTKDLVEEITPLYFIGSRFLIASLLLLLFAWRLLRRLTRFDMLSGAVAGLALAAAFNLQTFGIRLTTPGKAGLFTGTAVLWTPFLYFLWSRKPLRADTIISALIVFAGLALFSWKDSFDFIGLNAGDLLTLGGALFFAVHIMVVDRYHRNSKSELPVSIFVMMQLFVVGIVTLSFAAPLEPLPSALSPYGWFAYGFDLLFGTLLAYMGQIYAQKYAHPAHAGIIITFDSFFAYLFSWWLWGENLTVRMWAGIFMFVLGLLVAEAGPYIGFPMRAKRKSSKHGSDLA
ncbi:DMT family transporter [Ferviditalea candida]|uniref:DMT family transporter n=1 Tax=Ferviditalea candida TaxID=3108399 RepID=A0ABU5ZEA7_9BACL|nr:DMT family transporter [Paenibacillaceae bacterium T2]